MCRISHMCCACACRAHLDVLVPHLHAACAPGAACATCAVHAHAERTLMSWYHTCMLHVPQVPHVPHVLCMRMQSAP